MAYFRFRLVSLITRHMIDQSGLKIAQIEAYDLIKFLRKKWGFGVTWGYLGSFGKGFSRSPDQKCWGSSGYEKMVLKVTRGHLTKTGPPIASSEARIQEGRLVHKLPRAK